LKAPDHQAPIILAMDASLPVFVRFKHSSIYKNMIIKCPPNVSKIVSPATAGLVNLQQVIKQQVVDLSSNPEHLKTLPHSTTIWNELLRPELHPDGRVPDMGSLFEESQALLFGGADTTGTTLMHGTFHILKDGEVYQRLKAELQQVWPVLEDAPSQATLETLPYLVGIPKANQLRPFLN
jgi:Cytochrome P450